MALRAIKVTKRSLAAPVVFLLAVSFLLPVSALLARSFVEPIPGFGNYWRIVENPVYVHVLLNTVLIALSVTGICAFLAYPVAYTLATGSAALRGILAFCLIIPFWTSVLVRTFGWMVILQREGIINDLLMHLNLISEPLQMIYNRFGTLVGMVHILLPFMIFPLYSVMKRIDSSYVSAAATMGAGPVRAFLRVYLPLTKPGLLGGGTLVFIMSLGFFITPALLGGTKDAMIANLIEKQVIEFSDWGMAGALSVALLLTTVVVFAVSRHFFGARELWRMN